MTPVEATKTSAEETPRHFAARAALSTASFMPRAPVQALALPEFIRTALARPERTRACERTTGAAFTWLRVNTPAARQDVSE